MERGCLDSVLERAAADHAELKLFGVMMLVEGDATTGGMPGPVPFVAMSVLGSARTAMVSFGATNLIKLTVYVSHPVKSLVRMFYCAIMAD